MSEEKEGKPSRLHWWGGALSAGATVPLSWTVGGYSAAKEGVKGALIGGLIGLNSLFTEEEDDEDRG